ncbi:MAG: AI-2E family transporter [Acidimicrobiales bacterium]
MPEDKTSPTQNRRARILRSAESNQVPLRTIVVTLALVVAVYLGGKLLYRLGDVVMLMLVGGFVALVMNPAVVALQHWKLRRRGLAVGIVTFWGLVAIAGLAVGFGYPLVNGVTHLADNLPAYVNRAAHNTGWLGQLVRQYHLQDWVQKNSPKLVSLAEKLGKPAFAVGKGAVSVLVALTSTFVFVVLLLLEAPQMRTGLLSLMSPQRAERYVRIGGEVSRSVFGYVLGDLLTSFIAGLIVFVTLTLLSVPFALVWALWVALVDCLPVVGGAMAGIPTVLFAVGHSLSAGVATAVVFLVYTQLENHVLNPVIMSRTVKVNPLLVMVAVFVGADLGAWLGGIPGGLVAALLAIPITGAVQVLVRELWRATAPDEPGYSVRSPETVPRRPAGP